MEGSTCAASPSLSSSPSPIAACAVRRGASRARPGWCESVPAHRGRASRSREGSPPHGARAVSCWHCTNGRGGLHCVQMQSMGARSISGAHTVFNTRLSILTRDTQDRANMHYCAPTSFFLGVQFRVIDSTPLYFIALVTFSRRYCARARTTYRGAHRACSGPLASP